jgi:hypothetical protein
MFDGAKKQAMAELETNSLPKFLISETYNEIDAPLVVQGGSKDIESDIKIEDLLDSGVAVGTCAHCMKPIVNLNNALTVGDFMYHLNHVSYNSRFYWRF